MKLKNLILIIATIYSTQLLIAQNTVTSIILTVDMSDQEVSPEGVFVAGNFFNGIPEPLDDNGDGTWSYPASFTKGDSLFYLFRNGNIEEELKETTCMANDGQRRMLVVPDADTSVTVAACFNYCVTCSEITTRTNDFLLEQLTFRLGPNPMKYSAVASWTNNQEKIEMIQLLDMTGRILRAYENLNDTQLIIERGNLTKGIYLLKISNQSGKIASQKLVVQ